MEPDGEDRGPTRTISYRFHHTTIGSGVRVLLLRMNRITTLLRALPVLSELPHPHTCSIARPGQTGYDIAGSAMWVLPVLNGNGKRSDHLYTEWLQLYGANPAPIPANPKIDLGGGSSLPPYIRFYRCSPDIDRGLTPTRYIFQRDIEGSPLSPRAPGPPPLYYISAPI